MTTEFDPSIFEEDSQEVVAKRLGNENLGDVSVLVNRMIDLGKQIDQKNVELKELAKEKEAIETKLLPDLLRQMGVREMKLADGQTLTLETEYFAAITQERKEQAYDWLRKEGHGGIIKNVVSASFGKDMDESAQLAVEALQTLGIEPERKESVHGSTLKAFVKRMIQDGSRLGDDSFPRELFGVHEVTSAVLKVGRKKLT